ncbi:MAG TPA: hypothetical protein VIH18_24055 [Candidatus Binatia bacterium]
MAINVGDRLPSGTLNEFIEVETGGVVTNFTATPCCSCRFFPLICMGFTF